MKNLGKFAVLGAALAVSSSLAFADVISLGSVGLPGLDAGANTGGNATVTYVGSQQFGNDTTSCGGGNSFCLPAYTGNTAPIAGGTTTAPGTAVNLDPNGVWSNALAGSSWVGVNANAGPFSTINPEYGYYEFTTTFSANGGAGGVGYSGTLNVLADDTVEVFLNNTQAQILGGATPLIGFGAIGSDGTCADGAPSCKTTKIGTVNLNNVTLGGSNTLTFVVQQEGIGPVGGQQDPSGFDFTLNLAQTPEPSSLMLLGTGLTGAAGMLFRRRRTA